LLSVRPSFMVAHEHEKHLVVPASDAKLAAAPSASSLEERKKLAAVIGVLLAMFLATLDQTIVAPALPSIGAALGDADFLSWIISAYLLTSTATTPLYGKISDIYGRRPTLYAALAAFLVGSVGCALSPSMTALVLARAFQGLGGGGLIVLAQTVIADIVSPRERAKYVVYISAVWAISSVAGPVMGGALAQHVGWPTIFWINLPLGALAFAICRPALRAVNSPRRNHRVDALGSVLLTVSSVALMLSLTLTHEAGGWASPKILALLALSAGVGAALALHLRSAPEPLIPLALFKNEVIGMASLAIFFSMFAYVGSTVYVPLFMVSCLGTDATTAGASLIVLLAGTVVGANTAGRHMAKAERYKRMATAGLVVAFFSLLLLAAFADRLSFWGIEGLLLVLGVGLGPLFPTVTVSVQNAADPRDLGVATASLAFLRSFGGAIGVAILGAVLLGFGAVGSSAGPADATAFRWMFLLQAATVLASLASFRYMAEWPLRGPPPAQDLSAA
jgi:EmrB/QacA subfamily drug resistance transporter